MNQLAYLATPYSKYEAGLDAAFVDASKLSARLMPTGVKIYSPIVHCHPMAIHGGLNPLDHALWLPFDEVMMAKADILIVAHMQGWEESYGIAHEIAVFTRAQKPIFDLDIQTLTMVQRKGVA